MNETAADEPRKPIPLLSRVVATFMRGDVAVSLVIVSISLGGMALLLTPREEDPQITVPMADLIVAAPGLGPHEIERQITSRLERIIYQVEGVEHVYSRSLPERSITTVRFYVGQDRERALVRLQNEIDFFRDQIPPQVSDWVIKPRDVDDVPIVVATIWSEKPQLYDDADLRRMAEELLQPLAAIRDTNRVTLVGGRPERVRIELDPSRLAAHGTSALRVTEAVRTANRNARAGEVQQGNEQFTVESGPFLNSAEELGNLIVATHEGRPVFLREVATVTAGPSEVEHYSWIGFGPAADRRVSQPPEYFPAVHIAIAKRPGANNVWVADQVQSRLKELAKSHFPDGVHYRITRDYGKTANDKVNRLVQSLGVAVVSVMILLWLVLGWRTALVIGVAIPVCYALTLAVNFLIGYSINRVTLFALILALGLIVDDPITDVENIARYFRESPLPRRKAVLRAVQEVRPALIISTLTVIAAFFPLNLITGMMGPYMAPMSANVPIAVTISTVIVSFMLTPWLAYKIIGGGHTGGRGTRTPDASQEDSPEADQEAAVKRRPIYRFYNRLLRPVLERRWASYAVLALVVLLFLLALAPPVFRLVPIKMLPYDNKDEFLVVVDLPESATLEQTNQVARRIGDYLSRVHEVRDYEIFVGIASPVDFNGLVRRYYLRNRPNMASIRVNLRPKEYRQQQSHGLLLRLRPRIAEIGNKLGANIKLVEVPPGPPVVATITGVVHGPPGASYQELVDAARTVRQRLEDEPGVVDVDDSAEAPQQQWRFEAQRAKIRQAGVTEEQVAQTLQLAIRGDRRQVMHDERNVNATRIEFRLPRPDRSTIAGLQQLMLNTPNGQVPLHELGRFHRTQEPLSHWHQDLERVAYVYAEVAGRPPGDAIADLQADLQNEAVSETIDAAANPAEPRPLSERSWLQPGGGLPWSLPRGFEVAWSQEGEWEITLRVFRDLGFAYAAALIGIFAILMFQTGSRIMPLVIMSAIPLTLIGIMPGFWLLNLITEETVGGYSNPVFFTATSMIGIIVLSGVVIRNSVLLIEFVQDALEKRIELTEAIVQSVAVRTRPILLTAATTLVGNLFIVLDPIFAGLAWAIIFGIITSNLFTLLVVPVIYGLLFRKQSRSGRHSGTVP
jgi:multidrug efflux pump subunit AcrB